MEKPLLLAAKLTSEAVNLPVLNMLKKAVEEVASDENPLDDLSEGESIT
jgi:hypothetical protein